MISCLLPITPSLHTKQITSYILKVHYIIRKHYMDITIIPLCCYWVWPHVTLSVSSMSWLIWSMYYFMGSFPFLLHFLVFCSKIVLTPQNKVNVNLKGAYSSKLCISFLFNYCHQSSYFTGPTAVTVFLLSILNYWLQMLKLRCTSGNFHSTEESNTWRQQKQSITMQQKQTDLKKLWQGWSTTEHGRAVVSIDCQFLD